MNKNATLVALARKNPELMSDIKESQTLIAIFLLQAKIFFGLDMRNEAPRNDEAHRNEEKHRKDLVRKFKAKGINPFEVMGVDKDASKDTIKKVYKKEALELHPDKNRGNEEQAAENFKLLGQAFEILQNTYARDQFKKN